MYDESKKKEYKILLNLTDSKCRGLTKKMNIFLIAFPQKALCQYN